MAEHKFGIQLGATVKPDQFCALFASRGVPFHWDEGLRVLWFYPRSPEEADALSAALSRKLRRVEVPGH